MGDKTKLKDDVVAKSKKLFIVCENFLIGSIAGWIDTLIHHPLWAIKTRRQCSYPFTLNPKILYRGVHATMGCMVPAVAVRVTVTDILKDTLYKFSIDAEKKQMFSALLAGQLSAFITNPMEMVLTYQQKYPENFFQSALDISSQYGIQRFLRGWIATSGRDGITTWGFAAGVPIFKLKVRDKVKNDYIASIIAGSFAGFFSAVVSHPFDTVKTIQHSKVSELSYTTSQAIKDIYSRYGCFGFFRGLSSRGARVISTTTVLGFAIEKLNEGFNAWISPIKN